MEQLQSEHKLRNYIRHPDVDQKLERDPYTLVLLLMEGAMEKIQKAKTCHEQQKAGEKGFYLGRATAIIDSVRDRLASLLLGASMEVELQSGYDHVDLMLQQAIEEPQLASLDNSLNILAILHESWKELVAGVLSDQENIAH